MITRHSRSSLVPLILLLMLILAPGTGDAASSKKLRGTLRPPSPGAGVDVIVLLSAPQMSPSEPSRATGREARAERLERRAAVLRQQKERLFEALPAARTSVVKDYTHLPMAHMRVENPEALQALEAASEVVAIYPNVREKLFLSQSLPLIHQPAAKKEGFKGAGTSVAVIDNGIDLRKGTFGSCRSGGERNCKVSLRQSFAAIDDADVRHGTNVAGIVLGVAPATKIIALDIGDGYGMETADAIAAIDWCIANREAYNIVAMNMSFGSGRYYERCEDDVYAAPLAEARAAGIVPVAASGNDGYSDSVSRPACTPAAVSVGAVYDANIRRMSFDVCTDEKTSADRIACFSNSAPFLDLLAPGMMITAAGIKMGGTSQAAPHVAGAIAVLSSVFPDEGPDQLVARLKAGGVLLTDQRNDVWTPRLDLKGALDTRSVAMVTVSSTRPDRDVLVSNSPPDTEGVAGVVTPGSLNFTPGTTVALTAPELPSATFLRWDGCDSAEGPVCTLTASTIHAVTAVYDGGSAILGDAVDNASVVWRSGGAAPFFRTTETSVAGGDSAQTGAVGSAGKSWLETTVTGPADVSFSWRISAGWSDSLSISIDGVNLTSVYGFRNWHERTFRVGTGEHVVRWQYEVAGGFAGDASAGWVDNVRIVPVQTASISVASSGVGAVTVDFYPGDGSGLNRRETPFTSSFEDGTSVQFTAPSMAAGNPFLRWSGCDSQSGQTCYVSATGDKTVTAMYSVPVAVPLGEAVEAPLLTWTSGGSATWFAEDVISSVGGSAAQTGAIPSSAQTWLETTVTGPGILAYVWKVSSERGWDYLTFQVDGINQRQVSGEVDWTTEAQVVEAGQHRLRWRYAKDGGGVSGSDAGWIDNVRFTPVSSFARLTVNSENPSVGVLMAFDPVGAGTAPFAAPTTVTYASGTVVTVTAPAEASGNAFARWVGCGSVAERTCTVTLDTDTTVTAVYESPQQVPLLQALDNPDLVWTTGGQTNWYGQNAVFYAGGSAARSGSLTSYGSNWIETTVTGPAVVRFQWKIITDSWDSIVFLVNGNSLAYIERKSDWIQQRYLLGTGTNTLRWRYNKNYWAGQQGDAAYLDKVEVLPAVVGRLDVTSDNPAGGAGITIAQVDLKGAGSAVTPFARTYEVGATVSLAADANAGGNIFSGWEGCDRVVGTTCTVSVTADKTVRAVYVSAGGVALAEALDAPGLVWATGGSTYWAGFEGSAVTGTSVAKTGRISDAQQTWLETTVTGPGTLTYWWKVSSEAAYDNLTVDIDGIEQPGQISGQTEWVQRSHELTAGPHVVRWRYSKDGSISVGEDAGWVDGVALIPPPVPMAQ